MLFRRHATARVACLPAATLAAWAAITLAAPAPITLASGPARTPWASAPQAASVGGPVLPRGPLAAGALPAIAGSPIVRTGEAVVEGEAVVLTGAVDPDGEALEACVFEYGQTKRYGHSVSCSGIAGLGSGIELEPVASVAVSGLIRHTLFHYRILARNAAGVAEGSDATFTSGPSARVLTGPAGAIGETAATLSGTVDPGGEEVTACYFEFGPSPAFGQRAPCASSAGAGEAPVPETAALTGLAPGTTYYFHMVATTVVGRRYGAEASFTTLGRTPFIGPPAVRAGGWLVPAG